MVCSLSWALQKKLTMLVCILKGRNHNKTVKLYGNNFIAAIRCNEVLTSACGYYQYDLLLPTLYSLRHKSM